MCKNTGLRSIGGKASGMYIVQFGRGYKSASASPKLQRANAHDANPHEVTIGTQQISLQRVRISNQSIYLMCIVVHAPKVIFASASAKNEHPNQDKHRVLSCGGDLLQDLGGLPRAPRPRPSRLLGPHRRPPGARPSLDATNPDAPAAAAVFVSRRS